MPPEYELISVTMLAKGETSIQGASYGADCSLRNLRGKQGTPMIAVWT